MTYIVHVGFDPEHRLYFVHESDVPGLTVEAATVYEVIEIVQDAASDLLGEQASGAEFDFRIHVSVVA